MVRFFRVLALGSLILTAGVTACDPPLYGQDPGVIMERWRVHYFGTCSSWLYSHTSGKQYCASPPVELPAAALVLPAGPTFDTSKVDKDSLMAAGEKVYGNVCVACHQADGKGTPGAFPPLAGSGEFYGAPQNMAKIVVHGLSGEIVVQGVTWNSAMPPQGHLSDYEIAAATTYARNSWGNADGVVLPEDVAAVR